MAESGLRFSNKNRTLLKKKNKNMLKDKESCWSATASSLARYGVPKSDTLWLKVEGTATRWVIL